MGTERGITVGAGIGAATADDEVGDNIFNFFVRLVFFMCSNCFRMRLETLVGFVINFE
jgi:hypothetical protein